MTRAQRHPILRLAVLPTILAIGSCVLAGCEPEGTATAVPSATTTLPSLPPGPNPSETALPTSPKPSPSTTNSVAPSPTATDRFGRSCAQLVSAQTIYNYNPNFVAVAATAASGSGAAAALKANGVACAWENTTSGDTIVLGAARYSASQLAALKTAATGSTVAGWGDFGRFARSGSTGTASFAVGDAWATLSSTAFYASDDPAALVQSVVAALR